MSASSAESESPDDGVASLSAATVRSKAMVMSLFVFTGASQFAAVGVVDSGGSPVAAVGSALLLAARNSLYGVRMAPMVKDGNVPTFVGAHLVIDETTAMSTAHRDPELQRVGFWVTGVALFVFWNLGTFVGVSTGSFLGDPQRWGLDAAFLASFVALMGPHVSHAAGRVATAAGVAIAIAAVPFVPAGAPILLAAFGVVPALFLRRLIDGGTQA